MAEATYDPTPEEIAAWEVRLRAEREVKRQQKLDASDPIEKRGYTVPSPSPRATPITLRVEVSDEG